MKVLLNSRRFAVPLVLVISVFAASCVMPAPPAPEPPVAGATSSVGSVAPTESLPPATPTIVAEEPAPAVEGTELWGSLACRNCHGGMGEGGFGPALAGTRLGLDKALNVVRQGRGSMPAFGESDVSDETVETLLAWLSTLDEPTAADTPTPPPADTPEPTHTPQPTSTSLSTETPRPTDTAVPTDTPEPTATLAPTDTPEPTETATPSLPEVPDAAVGLEVWQQKPCLACHGQTAQGGIGPRLAGTGLSYDQVLLQVRSGAAPMPAYDGEEISDLELEHIYVWLRSLAPPTPTPIAPPSYPTGALLGMWQQVNDMKVKSDFAKDLPERQAGDDAGRLAILKAHANDALQLGRAAIGQANQARGEIPNERVRATIDRVISKTNRVMGLAEEALAQGSFVDAWPRVAEMVKICRLDAWPLATQAVREAGLVGTVQVRVTNAAGSPIGGAFVTVLTAHTPVGVRTDSSGRATIANVAAVPALQVKAYDAGLVYHEVHMNLSPGGTGGATIALPGPSQGGQTPSVANPSIEPSSGSGTGSLRLSVTATDPQGAANLAEDQIFALNPDIGLAYIMRSEGRDRYVTQEALPGLSGGVHRWYFFAVDHQCNTSTILPVDYTVQ